MKLIKVFVLVALVSQISFAQVNRPQPPIEPKFMNGGTQRFYQFITDEIDFSKIATEQTMRVTFYLDTLGIMNGIQATEFKNDEAATEVIRVLKKANKWDVSNQTHSFSLIRYRIKLLFNDKKVLGETQVSWDSKQGSLETDRPKPTEPIILGETDLIYNTAGVEKKPDFPGGLKEFYKYIGQNFKTPDVKGLAGKVFVTFVVEKDGSITDVKVLRDIGYGTGEEAVRVLKNSPNWIPAEQDGKKVRVLYSLPISIQPSK